MRSLGDLHREEDEVQSKEAGEAIGIRGSDELELRIYLAGGKLGSVPL